jgi:hypothetical protein
MEVKKRVEDPVDLIVKSNSQILMTIIIGNKQIGGAILEFKDEDPFAKGKIKDKPIGKGEDLFDKTLHVLTNVLDSNTANNRIVITHKFLDEGGAEIFSRLIEDEVDQHKDILSSDATYNFKKTSQ